jgi:hypothetical protein
MIELMDSSGLSIFRRFHLSSVIAPTCIFAHVYTTHLKAEAERWMLDRWSAGAEFTDWRTEPRRSRFPENSWRLGARDRQFCGTALQAAEKLLISS